MRLAVYSDFAYRRDGDDLWAEQAFSLFMAGLRPWVDGLVVVGRLDPRPGRWHYRVPADVEFHALPHYASLAHPASALGAAATSLRRFWRVLADVDAVWLLGPHPFSIAFALLALLRRRSVALGVRQHLPAYARNRHPGRRSVLAAALALEAAFRALGRVIPVVAVGPDIAHRYRHSRRVLSTSISLVSEDALAMPGAPPPAGEVRVLSVGRLDAEKNPLLLADVAARLADGFRLIVCGEGALEGALRERLAAAGAAGRVELRGYVPVGDGLEELYRSSHVFLHVSWTEGFPQVLVEAFAASLPVVATAVGGVPELVEDAALLVPAGDADAAASAVRRLAADPELRERLVAAGRRLARQHTLEARTRRVVEFIAGAGGR